ncbi:MAG: methionine--tRNA ligase [Myxococcota bacterium]
MSDHDPIYVTTPIYYVNGLPHIGHAYTTIIADAYARWHRLAGRKVFFLTGTDEHGQKVLQTAESRGMSGQEHVDDLVVHWKQMWDRLDIAYDRFIRTTDADHAEVVSATLQKIWDDGLVERKDYEGWYHVGDEIFVTDKDVEAGKYDPSELQRITESNYWFKMSAYQDQLLQHLEDNPEFIQPKSRMNEVKGFLRQPLGDLCISRPKARMSWGIELPFDEDYVCYVWFDALLNYLTGIGYHPDAAKAGEWKEMWPATFQLLGKDILTTHSVYWSTMLMALGVPLADCLYSHGWWTSNEGEKMSKSKGNAIDIRLLVEEFGPDAARYFFLREKALGTDGNFSYEGFLIRYNADLANDLGNLAHRGLSMTKNWLSGQTPVLGEATDLETALYAVAGKAVAGLAGGIQDLDFHHGLESLWDLVKAGNKYVDDTQPWALNKAGDTERLQTVLRTVLEVCHLTACCLLPIMPGKANELLNKLGRSRQEAEACLQHAIGTAADGPIRLDLLTQGHGIDPGDPLFPRIRELPPAIAALYDTVDPAETPKSKPKKKKAKKRTEPLPEIAFDDFAKLNLRVGLVQSAEAHPKADRLLVLKVDVGEAEPRQIVAGLAAKFAPAELVGRKVVVVANLAPADLRGVQSQGMILAAGDKEVVDLIAVDAVPGTVVR